MKNEKYELAKSSRDKFNALIKEVLSNVKPSKKEIDDAKFAINEIMGRLKKQTPKDVEILLAGSVARGTQIKGNSDMDVFLLFPRKVKEAVIEKKGLEIAKSIVNKKKNESYIVKYAEHPYTRLFLKDLNVNVDIVPAYKIETAQERGTAVDRTQLHNDFVNSNLTERQRDDVRVLKAFLKAHNVYGAEARTEGFSGYLCELMVYNYGSFLDVVTNMANIELPVAINLSKPKVTEPPSPKELVKLFGKNFVVVDPTDSERNVAANVSDESLFRFVLISRRLLASPSMLSFYGEKKDDLYSEKKLLALRDTLGANLYVVHFAVPDIADDILWQQLKRTRLRLNESLRAGGFEIGISLQDIEGVDAVMGFFIGNAHVWTTKVMGPTLEMGRAVEHFIKAHEKSALFTSIEKDRVYVIEKARHSDPESLIRGFIASRNAQLPSNLDPRKAKVYVNKVPEKEAKLVYRAFAKKFSV
jgi:tRNA nucleotidyltransferase (CCA-adding enzyme)